MVRNFIPIKHQFFENFVLQKYFHFLGECCTRVKVYYKIKTKAYEKLSEIYGSYTRVIGDDVNDRYYYQSNFANGYHGIWFCGGGWSIGDNSNLGRCAGSVRSFIRNICVHRIGSDWEYSDPSASVTGWSDAGEGLAVKCLYEPGNC